MNAVTGEVGPSTDVRLFVIDTHPNVEHRLAAMKTCPACQESVRLNVRVCPCCGHRFIPAAAWVFLIAVLLALLVGVLLFLTRSK